MIKSIIIAAAFALTAAPAMAQGFTLSELSADFWSDGEINEVASRGRVQTDIPVKIAGGWPCKPESPAAGQTARYVEVKIGKTIFALVKNDQPTTDYNSAGRAVKVFFTAGFDTGAGWQWSNLGQDHGVVNAGLSVSDGESVAPTGCTPFWE